MQKADGFGEIGISARSTAEKIAIVPLVRDADGIGEIAVSARSRAPICAAYTSGESCEFVMRRIIREQFQVSEDRIRPESSFVDDLGADSLRLVEMTLVFEDRFDIDIADEDVAKILTVRDAIEYVEKRVAAQHPE